MHNIVCRYGAPMQREPANRPIAELSRQLLQDLVTACERCNDTSLDAQQMTEAVKGRELEVELAKAFLDLVAG